MVKVKPDTKIKAHRMVFMHNSKEWSATKTKSWAAKMAFRRATIADYTRTNINAM